MVAGVAAATNDIDDEKSIENNCQLHTGCGMENNDFGRTCNGHLQQTHIHTCTLTMANRYRQKNTHTHLKMNTNNLKHITTGIVLYTAQTVLDSLAIFFFFFFFWIWIYLNNYYFKQLCAYNSVNERVSAQQWPPTGSTNEFYYLIRLFHFALEIFLLIIVITISILLKFAWLCDVRYSSQKQFSRYFDRA